MTTHLEQTRPDERTRALAAWLADADALLTHWDTSRSDDLDALVERGLALTEDGADLSVADSARLALVLARVIAGITERRNDVVDQIEALHRQRLDLTRSATGIAGYISASDAI